MTRGTARHLGGSRVRYTWPCGHTETKDHARGPIPKRIGEQGVRLLVTWWAKDGVYLPPCQKCKRKQTRGGL